jgi:hypothetical protein
MDKVDAPRGASFGLSLLVALGWYATLTAAVLVGWSGIPAAPDRDCSAAFSCLTRLQTVGLLAIALGGPVLMGLLSCTFVVTGLLARRLPSSILTGTLSVLGAVAIVAVVGAVWHGVR